MVELWQQLQWRHVFVSEISGNSLNGVLHGNQKGNLILVILRGSSIIDGFPIQMVSNAETVSFHVVFYIHFSKLLQATDGQTFT